MGFIGDIFKSAIKSKTVQHDSAKHDEDRYVAVSRSLPENVRPFGIDPGVMAECLGWYYAGSKNRELIHRAIEEANSVIGLVRSQCRWSIVDKLSEKDVALVDANCNPYEVRMDRVCVAVHPSGPTKTGKAPKYQCDVNVSYEESPRYVRAGHSSRDFAVSDRVEMSLLPDGTVGKASVHYFGSIRMKRISEHAEIRLSSGRLFVSKATQSDDDGPIHEFKA